MRADWHYSPQKLTCTLRFVDFDSAFSFITQVALLAARYDHHPVWSQSYNEVKLELFTHDAGNLVSQKDRDLAKEIDRILVPYTFFQND
jgi:4a-hydroxytetrahydrobiopterin dehydratase